MAKGNTAAGFTAMFRTLHQKPAGTARIERFNGGFHDVGEGSAGPICV
jgi:hypothetical protein